MTSWHLRLCFWVRASCVSTKFISSFWVSYRVFLRLVFASSSASILLLYSLIRICYWVSLRSLSSIETCHCLSLLRIPASSYSLVLIVLLRSDWISRWTFWRSRSDKLRVVISTSLFFNTLCLLLRSLENSLFWLLSSAISEVRLSLCTLMSCRF